MKLLPLLLVLLIHQAHAYVDLSLMYTFSRQVIEGEEDKTDPDRDTGEAVSSTEGYSATWAWYMWEYTALEFSHSQSTNNVTDDRRSVTQDKTLTIVKADSTVKTTVNGVGIRQAFANRNARFIPSLSLGWAEFVSSGYTTYSLELEDTNGDIHKDKIKIERDTIKQSSSYAALQLRIKITELVGLSFGARTVMPEFDTSKAGNNVTYSAGFSWVF